MHTGHLYFAFQYYNGYNKVKLSNCSSVYCSSSTGPESFDSPVEFVLQKMFKAEN